MTDVGATPLRELVEARGEEIKAIVARHHGRSVAIFGSVARGDERPGASKNRTSCTCTYAGHADGDVSSASTSAWNAALTAALSRSVKVPHACSVVRRAGTQLPRDE